ncbi:Receptor-likey region, transmembrane domain- and RING domain-containing protein 1 [Symbiodinium microadriaticum]|uniref:Receptor-likey region, transmembrane domain-and RING domain-containing protein 1 n=1 Tax=Symbiodinium microadriaticum TaxID=2951 RepID=A0A1Q9DK81_SYMMI|nr:Receptor-likey region, transmembrane domain- and RING domain-containing protein 1 [Symbiodinium microadriaticum]
MRARVRAQVHVRVLACARARVLESNCKRLRPEEVRSLPCAEFEAADGQSCSICLEQFGPADAPRLLSCQHAFHTECALLWLTRAAMCPNCRAPVECADAPVRPMQREADDYSEVISNFSELAMVRMRTHVKKQRQQMHPFGGSCGV